MSLEVILMYIYFNAARGLTGVCELWYKQEIIKAYKKSEGKYLQSFNFSIMVKIHGKHHTPTEFIFEETVGCTGRVL